MIHLQIIESVCYLLCDIFIPKNTNLKCPNLEDLIVINPLAFDDNANKDSSRKENEFSEFKSILFIVLCFTSYIIIIIIIIYFIV